MKAPVLPAVFALFVASSALAQIPSTPGIPAAAQAQQAFAMAQMQAATMTSQAQLNAAIAMQAGMLTSTMARSMFMSQAAMLHVNQSQMFYAGMMAAQVAAMQRRLQVQTAILRVRNLGLENQAAMKDVALLASVYPAMSLRTTAMLHAEAAQAAGQTASAPQTPTAPPAADAVSGPVEPPPMMMRPTFGNSLVEEKPKFSVESGTVSAGTKIKVKSETHYSTIYYTTNGWTPTTQSAKYTGPITINATTHLQVIAVGPNFLRSSVERADYEVPNTPAPAPETVVTVPGDGVLHVGTPVRVVFGGKDIDSETAEVGDEITLLLDEDIKMGDTVVAAKGSKVNAALTIADPGHSSAPGDLVFEVHSVDVGGKRVPLFGGETLEGVKGGKNAVIKPGMVAMAFVSADTVVKP